MNETQSRFQSVYGPVNSWRYGRSLGIDPIGSISTCSFNCVYCQLGEIEHKSTDRQVFVTVEKIATDLQTFAPWEVDVITLSGSGEPTLALNLGEILRMVKEITLKPVGVLTNGTLLGNPSVQADLAIADQIAVKMDALSANQLQRINRPVSDIKWDDLLAGLRAFRRQYQGILAIQTMVLSPWTEQEQTSYITAMGELAPDEIQLNTPTRPKPLTHQLDARGNHEPTSPPYAVQSLKFVSPEVLQSFGDRVQNTLRIPVRCAPSIKGKVAGDSP